MFLLPLFLASEMTASLQLFGVFISPLLGHAILCDMMCLCSYGVNINIMGCAVTSITITLLQARDVVSCAKMCLQCNGIIPLGDSSTLGTLLCVTCCACNDMVSKIVVFEPPLS